MSPTKRSLGIEDIAAIAVVMVISAGIGVYFRFSGGRQKTTKEFLVAGRTMSPFPVVFSLIVTFVSATLMLGVPKEVYEYGLYRILAYICSTISNVICAYIFLPVYFQMGDSVSVYEYIERRFGTLTRKVSSVLFILQTAFFMAVVLYAPALALSAVSDININIAIVSIGGICTLYCCLGGMKAVLWTDVFQAIIMYICTFAIFIRGIIVAQISFPEAFRLIHDHENTFFSFDPSVRYTVWNCMLYGFLYGMFNYGCNQAEVQRMLSVKSLKLSQRAVIISVPLAIIFITLNFLLGVVMYANYYPETIWSGLDLKRDQMVPHFIMNNFLDYPGLPGICIAGIFCGSLSTISSSVNSLAAVTMEDFVQPYFATKRKLTERTATGLAKFFACAYGIVAIGCAFIMKAADKGLVYAITIVHGTVSGPILGLFLLGMMTTTANGKGALSGLLSGILISSILGIVSSIKEIPCRRYCGARLLTAHTSVDITNAQNMICPTNGTNDIVTEITIIENSTVYNITNSTNEWISNTTEIVPAMAKPSCCEKGEYLSIMWLMIIGFAVTMLVGYITSLLTKWQRKKGRKKSTVVDPGLLSPLVRKWLMKSLPQIPQDDGEEFAKLNGSAEA